MNVFLGRLQIEQNRESNVFALDRGIGGYSPGILSRETRLRLRGVAQKGRT
jgi:hypothetical protein